MVYGVGMDVRRGTGKAKCHFCHELIGKNQPCIYISVDWKRNGYMHAMATECQYMINRLKLRV